MEVNRVMKESQGKKRKKIGQLLVTLLLTLCMVLAFIPLGEVFAQPPVDVYYEPQLEPQPQPQPEPGWPHIVPGIRLYYEVEYYKDGQIVADETVTGTSWLATANPKISVDYIDHAPDKFPGYALDKTTPGDLKNIVLNSAYETKPENPLIIKVYYVTDPGPMPPCITGVPFEYKVEYYKDGKIVSNDTITRSAMLVSGETTVNLDQGVIRPENKYPGYTLVQTEPVDLKKVDASNSVGMNPNDPYVVKVHYLSNAMPMRVVHYQINHYLDGQLVNRKTIIGQKSVLPWATEIDLHTGILSDKFSGYKVFKVEPTENLKSISIPDSVGTSSVNPLVINRHYGSSLAPGMGIIRYSVEYYKDGVLVPEVTTTDIKWINYYTTIIDLKAEVDVSANKFPGCTLVKTSPENLAKAEFPHGLSSGYPIVIKVYYETQSKPNQDQKAVNYKVEYYKDGIIVNEDTTYGTKVVYKNHTVMNLSQDVDRSSDKYPGYHYTGENSINGLGLFPIPANGEDPVVKIYYNLVYTSATKFTYQIEYYKDGVIDDDATVIDSKWIGCFGITADLNAVVERSSEKFPGYLFDKVEPIIDLENVPIFSGPVVIKVYYVSESNPEQPEKPVNPNPEQPEEPENPENPNPEQKPEKPVDKNHPTAKFVTRFYDGVFEREPDEEGLSYWVNGLENHEKTAAEIAHFFFVSSEMENLKLSNSAYIERLYTVLMGRPSDPSGKEHWLDLLEKGVSREGMLRQFLYSQEFSNICKEADLALGSIPAAKEPRDVNPQLTSFMYRMYEVVFNRSIDIGGLNFWADQYLSGKMPMVDIAKELFFSQEAKDKNWTNSEYLKVLYRTFFNREADPGGLQYWMNELQNGASYESVLGYFADSEEFKGVVKGFNL